MEVLPDVSSCPLCGSPNQCALLGSNESSDGCWCEAVTVPEALLASVPAAARNLACICAGCIERFDDRDHTPSA